MALIELAIDLGSKYITVCQKGIGLVWREPAVAVARRVRDKVEITDVGYKAESIISSSLGGANIICPVKEGSIADEEMFVGMIKIFFEKILPSTVFPTKVHIMVGISSALSSSDRRVIEKCFMRAGAKEVTLVESPLCLLAYTGSIGGLFVDIGGGKTEVAAVTNHGIACGATVNIAGDAFNSAIVDAAYTVHGAKIGEYTVEKLKKTALSFYLNDEGSYTVSGGGKEGLPKNIRITAGEMRDAVLPLVDNIIDVIYDVMYKTPPELASEILRKGIFITGGSSRIPGLIEYMERTFELPLTSLYDADSCVALGGVKFFDDRKMLSDLIGISLD